MSVINSPQGSSWDADTLEAKAQDFAGTYVRVLIPGISYTATQFALFAAAFVSAWTTLAVSGLGYTNLVELAGRIEPLQQLLERVDPAWGNTALSFLVLELIAAAHWCILGAHPQDSARGHTPARRVGIRRSRHAQQSVRAFERRDVRTKQSFLEKL